MIVLSQYRIVVKLYDAIVIKYSIGSYIFSLYFLVVTVVEYHWIFSHIINIFIKLKPHRPSNFSILSWLVMWLGFIGSLPT